MSEVLWLLSIALIESYVGLREGKIRVLMANMVVSDVFKCVAANFQCRGDTQTHILVLSLTRESQLTHQFTRYYPLPGNTPILFWTYPIIYLGNYRVIT